MFLDVGHDTIRRYAATFGTTMAAVSLAMMGGLNLRFADTLLQWQPLPTGFPARSLVAYASAAILIGGTAALLASRSRRAGAAVAAMWIALWAVALHLPLVVASGGSVATLNGLAENVAMAAGLGMLAVAGAARSGMRIAFGLCCIVFGTAHFVYADFTAGMVPAWMPQHLLVAYATGTVHLANGLLLLFGIFPIEAAIAEAAMMACFVLLLHLPRVVSSGGDRLEVTMLAVATMLTSAAMLVCGGCSPGAWQLGLARS